MHRKTKKKCVWADKNREDVRGLFIDTIWILEIKPEAKDIRQGSCSKTTRQHKWHREQRQRLDYKG
jgi:hypothetical protein